MAIGDLVAELRVADGRLRFTPTGGFVGDTPFSYKVADGHGGQATALVRSASATPRRWRPRTATRSTPASCWTSRRRACWPT
ncbi:Ig-like domain-containing protein, partial [Pelomonas sp. KK5]|uniref:Ig-like domain-containing protein n=1 Tax=Pelomonas sp. KK5 TaxID=1855730 RepID=UPI003512B3EE